MSYKTNFIIIKLHRLQIKFSIKIEIYGKKFTIQVH